MRSPRVIISGGGTGGHVFPAIAIADAIREQQPDAELLFVGAHGRIEMDRVPAAGYKIEGLWISGFQRRITIKNLLFPFKVIASMLRASKILREFKPDVAVGVGGYASGPLLRAAISRKVPCLIQEQNSFPGVTNRILAPRVDAICVAYQGMEKWFPKEKLVLTGNPVRASITNASAKRDTAAAHFGLQPGPKTLLVIGGSLGARTINESMEAGIDRIVSVGCQVIWQTGNVFAERAADIMQKKPLKGVWCGPFIDRMDFAYAMADLVISRAGAISVSELCIVAKPVIFVPSPHVAEDHQTKNAKALTSVDAAVMVRDSDAHNILVDEALSILADDTQRMELADRIAKLARPDAATHIASEVLKLIRTH